MDTSGLIGKSILAAHFNTTELYSDACTSNVYSLNIMGGIGTGTTWGAQPRYYSTVSKATLGPQRSGCATQTGVGFDAKAVALSAAQQGVRYMTVDMQADNEADWTSWRRFAHGATMTVTYDTPPANPANPSTNGQGCSTTAPGPVFVNTSANQMSLAISATDPDAGSSIGVEYHIDYASDGTNALDVGVYPNKYIWSGLHAQGPTSTLVPTTALNGGKDGRYEWLARSYDGIDHSPGYSTPCFFQIKNPPPPAPVLTPDPLKPTTTTVTAGDTMTVKLAQQGANDGVVEFAYTWQAAGAAPVHSALPDCNNDMVDGGIHVACGPSASIVVTPEESPLATLTVWAYNAAETPSDKAQLKWTTEDPDPTLLYDKSHQWITDAGGPAPANCPSGGSTVTCVADNNLTGSSTGPAGQYPIPLTPGVTWDASGASTSAPLAPSGVLGFGPASTTPMITDPAAVVDTTKSFTVGAWLTPTKSLSTYETAVSERGTYNSGFYLQITSSNQWRFVVGSTQNSPTATSAEAEGSTVSYGQPKYVAGVYDLINHEVRLYVGGSLAAVKTYWPDNEPSADAGIALGSAWTQGHVSDNWTGLIGNPVVVPGALTPSQLTQLETASFFP
ncbi:MAG: LamG domain-containing protein [Frankiaceae bacterium]